MKRLIALLLLTQSSTILAQTAQEPIPTTVTMGDDGAVEVPLEFSFPLYDQLFTTSWMYDNGIISFLAPNSPGSVSPWQWSAQPVSNIGNYYIASLWADIAPTSITKYTYQSDPTQMKYTWTNIAEYYSAGSPSPRYSTFSTTIKPDGTISTSYASVNLQSSSISAGIVGNSSAGQSQSYYWSPCCTTLTTGGISDWTYIGNYVPPPPPSPEPPDPPPPPPPDPIPVQEFIEEPIVYEPVAPQESVPSLAAPVAEPTSTQTVATVAEVPTQQVAQQVMVSTPETNTSQTTQALPSVSVQASSDKKTISVDAQSIAKNNQKNLAALTDSVVSTSIQGSIESGTKSAESSMSSGSASVSGTSIKIAEQTIANTIDSVNQTQNQTQSSSTTLDLSKSSSANVTTSTNQNRNQASKVFEVSSVQYSSSIIQNGESQSQLVLKVSEAKSEQVSSSIVQSREPETQSISKVSEAISEQSSSSIAQNREPQTQSDSKVSDINSEQYFSYTPQNNESQPQQDSRVSDINSEQYFSYTSPSNETETQSDLKVSDINSEQYFSYTPQNNEIETQSALEVPSETVVISPNFMAVQDLSTQIEPLGQQETYQATAADQYASLIQPPVFAQEQQEDTQVVEPATQSIEDTLAMFKPYAAGVSDVSSEIAQDFINSQIEEQTSIANIGTEVPNVSVTDDINPTSIRSLSNAVLAMKAIEEEEQKKEVADTVPDNDPALTELAESGAKLEALQVLPIGYFNYLNLAYKDVPFYKDRVIYRKQKPVDNLRILRLLNARSDLTYNKMLETQYSLEDM